MIKLISEIGSNHNQDFNRCIKLIEQSKALGFYAVKLQLFKAEKLYKDQSKWDELKQRELPLEWLPEISKYCKSIDIKFGITPFYLEAIDESKQYVDYFKISSFDILRKDLIKKCLETGKDVYISCGLAEKDDIENIINNLTLHEHQSLTLMHCMSEYPTKYYNANIGRLRDVYSMTCFRKSAINNFLFVGYSDHTKDIDVIMEAISSYASCIEMHFDLDDEAGAEYKYGHCWTPFDIQQLYVRMDKVNSIIQNNFELTKEALTLRANSKTGLRE